MRGYGSRFSSSGMPRFQAARTRRPGQRLAVAFQALGPTFVKLGQALSVRSDLVGEEVGADLSQLQDRLPPFSSTAARATIEAELGRTLDEIFAAFEDEAVAAASIAQVHRAVTTEGAEVAVKVLRPNIEGAFDRDIDLMRWLARIISRLHPSLDRLKPIEVVETFAETALMEMDLRLEAAAAQELQANFEDTEGFEVPTVDWRRTGRRVLTLSWVEGVPIHDRERLEADGHDLAGIVALMASVFFFQIFRDGFFHADLHPGNLLVDKEGTVHAVDFGIMGRVDRPTRRYLADMLHSFLVRDYRRVAEIHVSAGLVPGRPVGIRLRPGRALDRGADSRAAAQRDFAGAAVRPALPGRETLQDGGAAATSAAAKTMLVAEGVGRGLHPGTNMWELAWPLIEEWMAEQLGPRARVRENVETLADAIARLPKALGDLERAVDVLARNRIQLDPETVGALRAGLAGRRRGAVCGSRSRAGGCGCRAGLGRGAMRCLPIAAPGRV